VRFVWQISAGQLFESIRPIAFALAAFASTCVLFDARRRRFNSYAVISWTLGTLFFSLIFLPLYIIVCITQRQRGQSEKEVIAAGDSDKAVASLNKQILADALPQPLAFRWLLPILYALLLLSLGAHFFYRDARSVDAHLARANQARVMNERERTIREYRQALQLEDDAHTHNLLAIELAAATRYEEALSQFRAAEMKGEPDDELPFHIANTLDALNRSSEAALEYQKFLNTAHCAQSNPFPQCDAARTRMQATQTNNKP
jgi:tetratricopeptide (TPR) repeat protein